MAPRLSQESERGSCGLMRVPCASGPNDRTMCGRLWDHLPVCLWLWGWRTVKRHGPKRTSSNYIHDWSLTNFNRNKWRGSVSINRFWLTPHKIKSCVMRYLRKSVYGITNNFRSQQMLSSCNCNSLLYKRPLSGINCRKLSNMTETTGSFAKGAVTSQYGDHLTWIGWITLCLG
jgi:hypothetical protein